MDLEARKVTLFYLVQRKKTKKRATWFYFFIEENRGLECRGGNAEGKIQVVIGQILKQLWRRLYRWVFGTFDLA